MAARGNVTAAGRRPVAQSTINRPRMTRSAQLREAKNVAVVLPENKPAESRKPPRPREGYAKVAPPPAPPRKVAFDKPKMTKAMMARQEQAQRKLEEERKKQAAIEAKKRGRRSTTRRSRSPARGEHVAAAAAEILEESRHQAKSGNAEIVQAVAVGDGDVGTIIIPPGVVHEEQTTIVHIVPPEEAAEAPPAAVAGPSGAPSLNRSIQMISQSLNEQEAAEAAAVQDRLDDFQQARREFIMELATLTAPGIDPDLSILDIDRMPLEEFEAEPSPPRRKLQRVPDLEDDMFRLEYGRDHPAIVAAREYLARKEAQKRVEERFEQAAHDVLDEFDLDVPLYQDVMDADISFEEDEHGNAMPCKSRVKAPMPRAQRRPELRQESMFYPHSTIRGADVDELERFFNIEKYPPARSPRPPPGRERLHRDLWELEDPWYREPPQPEGPDLMEFSR